VTPEVKSRNGVLAVNNIIGCRQYRVTILANLPATPHFAMNQSLKKPIKTLCPLPSGNGQYITFLTQLLENAVSSAELNRRDFLEWLITWYQITPNTAAEVFRMVIRLGLIQVERSGCIAVSSFGEEFMAEDIEGQIRLLAELLMQYGVAMPQVLGIFNNELIQTFPAKTCRRLMSVKAI
jgi:hypothetical protein